MSHRSIYQLYVEYSPSRHPYWGLIPEFLSSVFPSTFGKYCRDVLKILQNYQKLINIKIILSFRFPALFGLHGKVLEGRATGVAYVKSF